MRALTQIPFSLTSPSLDKLEDLPSLLCVLPEHRLDPLKCESVGFRGMLCPAWNTDRMSSYFHAIHRTLQCQDFCILLRYLCHSLLCPLTVFYNGLSLPAGAPLNFDSVTPALVLRNLSSYQYLTLFQISEYMVTYLELLKLVLRIPELISAFDRQ
ncbi:unnamed protein product [Heligmosomoides polygyrus]|uniref:Ovule protein n=1 Tax=Heligmosomoides polygyrus TaxID=6339 RepID=A0A183FGU7_HELPZ|nr:unnamed protein product [Heligmosomoides polygyrus]